MSNLIGYDLYAKSMNGIITISDGTSIISDGNAEHDIIIFDNKCQSSGSNTILTDGSILTNNIILNNSLIVNSVSISNIELGYLDGLTSNIQNQINAILLTDITTYNNIWSGTNTFNNSVIFNGSVIGLTKTMVGLNNVDNTSDSAKPVSILQNISLNLKPNLSGTNVFTGLNRFSDEFVFYGTRFSVTGVASMEYLNCSTLTATSNVVLNGHVLCSLRKGYNHLYLYSSTHYKTTINNNTILFYSPDNFMFYSDNINMLTISTAYTATYNKAVFNSLVGIGTYFPSCELEVIGDSKFDGDVTITGISTFNNTVNINGIIGSNSVYSVNEISFGGNLNLISNSIILSQTELSYLDGITSNIQSQLNSKIGSNTSDIIINASSNLPSSVKGSLTIKKTLPNDVTSIVFTSVLNYNSDYSSIEYYDSVYSTYLNYFSQTVNSESSCLFITNQNDEQTNVNNQDNIVIRPSGNLILDVGVYSNTTNTITQLYSGSIYMVPNSGNVLIGSLTKSPSSSFKLEVTGDSKFNGTLTCGLINDVDIVNLNNRVTVNSYQTNTIVFQTIFQSWLSLPLPKRIIIQNDAYVNTAINSKNVYLPIITSIHDGLEITIKRIGPPQSEAGIFGNLNFAFILFPRSTSTATDRIILRTSTNTCTLFAYGGSWYEI